jgi:hypothetical protein
MGGDIGLLKICTLGFERYARRYITNYQGLRDTVIAYLMNNDEERKTNTILATQLQQPTLVIDHILHQLAEESLIDLVETLGNKDNIRVYNISPELRRKWRRDHNDAQ